MLFGVLRLSHETPEEVAKPANINTNNLFLKTLGPYWWLSMALASLRVSRSQLVAAVGKG